MTLDQHILSFLENLHITGKIPKGIKVMNPYKDAYAFGLCKQFYKKYYHDNHLRTLLLGINPGRFGSGTTGISFTDPVKLEVSCGIKNILPKKPELSADFIYRMIDRYGGPELFYRRFMISAVSPLGFIKDGKNINYYDVPKLEKAIAPFIINSLSTLTSTGIDRKKCFCIGEGKNFDFLHDLNKNHRWFGEVVPLAHPRFIMQYKRKKVDEYIEDYLEKLKTTPLPVTGDQ